MQTHCPIMPKSTPASSIRTPAAVNNLTVFSILFRFLFLFYKLRVLKYTFCNV